MPGDDEYLTNSVKNVLILLWQASGKTTIGGRKYFELTLWKRTFLLHYSDGTGLSLYRTHSLACNNTILEDEDDREVEGQRVEGVISRVFRSKRPEISPNISYYSAHLYPQRDFALNCGIVASLCLPHFRTVDHSGRPDGVIEIVSTCDKELMRIFDFHFSLQDVSVMITSIVSGQPRIQIREPAIPIMDHFLTTACLKFPLPLAQYWTIRDPNLGALHVMHQSSNQYFEHTRPWCKFKDACLRMHMNIGEGLVGKTYLSQKSYFCRDITKLCITNYPLAHYAQTCGSIACFTICLYHYKPPCIECVLEFFLPSQEMDSYYPQTILNSLLATMKEHLHSCMVTAEGQLGEVLPVEVIDFSPHNKAESFKIAQLDSSFPDMEGSEERTGQNENVLDIQYKGIFVGEEKDDTAIHFVSRTFIEDTSQKRKQPVKDISSESLREHFGRPLDDAAKSFGVSRSTFKRMCRDHGIKRWQYGQRRMDGNISTKLRKRLNDEEASRMNFNLSGRPPVQGTPVAISSRDLNKMRVKATYNGVSIRFGLNYLSGILELENNVIERLHLERKSFSIRYQDDDDDWVVIACDKDVEECMEISRSLNKTTIKMLIDLPIIHYAP